MVKIPFKIPESWSRSAPEPICC